MHGAKDAVNDALLNIQKHYDGKFTQDGNSHFKNLTLKLTLTILTLLNPTNLNQIIVGLYSVLPLIDILPYCYLSVYWHLV